MHDRDRPGTPWATGRTLPPDGAARADPDGLDRAAAALERTADSLAADTARLGGAPVPGFAAGAAATAWEEAMVRSARAHAADTASTAAALRAAAAAWRTAEEDATAAFTGRAS